MECPYCGSELIQSDTYGKIKYSEHYWIYPRSWIERIGDIFYCPNREGFDDVNDAIAYQKIADGQKELLPEEVVCESNTFKGFFYTDNSDNLHEGYPC